jgi:hypothetical protein
MGLRGPKETDLGLLAWLEWDYTSTLGGIRFGTERTQEVWPPMPKLPEPTKSESWNRASVEKYRKSLMIAKEIKIQYKRKRALSPKLAVWELLTKARTLKQVRQAYEQAGYWKPRLTILRDHPEGFLAAKRGPRYPRSNRPTSDEKRIRYLARSMAGIHMGLSPATSITLLEALQREAESKRTGRKREG